MRFRRRHCGDVEWDTASPRWGDLLVLLVRPLLDHFDGLFCGWLGIGLWVKGGR